MENLKIKTKYSKLIIDGAIDSEGDLEITIEDNMINSLSLIILNFEQLKQVANHLTQIINEATGENQRSSKII